MNRIQGALALTLSCVSLLSCGGGGGSDPSDIRVEGGWARAMPRMEDAGGVGTNSAVYFLLRNVGGAGDRLTGVETSAADAAQIHESGMVGDVMRMRRVDGVDLPAGAVVDLTPGGLHIMLMNLTKSLVEGEEIDLTLHFQDSEDLVVRVPVRLSGEA